MISRAGGIHTDNGAIFSFHLYLYSSRVKVLYATSGACCKIDDRMLNVPVDLVFPRYFYFTQSFLSNIITSSANVYI